MNAKDLKPVAEARGVFEVGTDRRAVRLFSATHEPRISFVHFPRSGFSRLGFRIFIFMS